MNLEGSSENVDWQGERRYGAPGLRRLGADDSMTEALSYEHSFSRYLAAARGELPFETYHAEMRRRVHLEIDAEVWARRTR